MSEAKTEQTKTIGQKISEFFSMVKNNPDVAVEVSKFIDEQRELGKAVPHADGEIMRVEDGYMAGRKDAVPTKEEIKTGPTFGARGGSAEAMNSEYSNNSPQMGIQLVAERLNDVVGAMHATTKAITEQSAKLDTLLASKAKEDEDEEDEEEEQEEVVEINEKSATKLITAAKKHIAKGDELVEQADEATDMAAEKTLKKQAKAHYRKAGRLLGKARAAAYACGEKGKELRKSIRLVAKKADIEVVQEEEEEEDEEEEKSLSNKPAAPAAKGDDKGNQADKQDPENGNQADAAAKAADAALRDKIEAALKGQTTLSATVGELMDLVRGMGAPNAPKVTEVSLMKGDPAQVDALLQARMSEAYTAGQLSQLDLVTCQTIAARLDAARSGAINESVVKGMIATAPSGVKAIFREAVAA